MYNRKRFRVLRVEFSACMIEEVVQRFGEEIAINEDIASV